MKRTNRFQLRILIAITTEQAITIGGGSTHLVSKAVRRPWRAAVCHMRTLNVRYACRVAKGPMGFIITMVSIYAVDYMEAVDSNWSYAVTIRSYK